MTAFEWIMTRIVQTDLCNQRDRASYANNVTKSKLAAATRCYDFVVYDGETSIGA